MNGRAGPVEASFSHYLVSLPFRKEKKNLFLRLIFSVRVAASLEAKNVAWLSFSLVVFSDHCLVFSFSRVQALEHP